MEFFPTWPYSFPPPPPPPVPLLPLSLLNLPSLDSFTKYLSLPSFPFSARVYFLVQFLNHSCWSAPLLTVLAFGRHLDCWAVLKTGTCLHRFGDHLSMVGDYTMFWVASWFHSDCTSLVHTLRASASLPSPSVLSHLREPRGAVTQVSSLLLPYPQVENGPSVSVFSSVHPYLVTRFLPSCALWVKSCSGTFFPPHIHCPCSRTLYTICYRVFSVLDIVNWDLPGFPCFPLTVFFLVIFVGFISVKHWVQMPTF